MKNKWLLLIGTGTMVFFLLFIITTTWIGVGVEENCERAMAKYQGECVEALTAKLADETNSFKDRNDAIWTLGQLGDKSALPVLKQYQTENEEKTDYDQEISQYELSKAIKWLETGRNITHVFRW